MRRRWTSCGSPISPIRARRRGRCATRRPARRTRTVDAYVLRGAGGVPVRVDWDRDWYPYLTRAHWDEHGPLIAVQSRDQRRVRILAIDPVSGETSALDAQSDEDWVDLIRGVPRRLADGRLVTATAAGDTIALLVDGRAVTLARARAPRGAVGAGSRRSCSPRARDRARSRRGGGAPQTSSVAADRRPGVHTAHGARGVHVIGSSSMEHDGARWMTGEHVFESFAERPVVAPIVELAHGRRARTAGRRRDASPARTGAQAPGPAGSLRWPSLPARDRGAARMARVTVARRPGVRGDRRRRARDARPRPQLGATPSAATSRPPRSRIRSRRSKGWRRLIPTSI